jgi:hypothetical protein
MLKRILGMTFLFWLVQQPLQAHDGHRFQMEVLVNGTAVPDYHHGGKVYVEALKDREYAIRLSNPLNTRVAVALSVDGLNSIDARNTEAFLAKKWVLQPYESIVIEGWQVNQQQARKFFFTSEEKSYGQWLGKTQNLGVISAVFFTERARWDGYSGAIGQPAPEKDQSESKTADRDKEPGAPPSSRSEASGAGNAASQRQRKEDYAATGIGRRLNHDIQWVSMDLDPTPVAILNLRYEFRTVLVKLGILPTFISADALNRREHARGFKDVTFCPEPR